MTIAVIISLAGLVIGLLGALLTTTWKFSALATKLLSAVEEAEEDKKALEKEIEILRQVPVIRRDLDEVRQAAKDTSGAVHKMHTEQARLATQMGNLESRLGSLKEMRSPWKKQPSPSRPEPEDEDDGV